MRSIYFAIGVFVGYFIGFKDLPIELITIICAIPIAIEWYRAEKKEKEKEAIELAKHSFY